MNKTQKIITLIVSLVYFSFCTYEMFVDGLLVAFEFLIFNSLGIFLTISFLIYGFLNPKKSNIVIKCFGFLFIFQIFNVYLFFGNFVLLIYGILILTMYTDKVKVSKDAQSEMFFKYNQKYEDLLSNSSDILYKACIKQEMTILLNDIKQASSSKNFNPVKIKNDNKIKYYEKLNQITESSVNYHESRLSFYNTAMILLLKKGTHEQVTIANKISALKSQKENVLITKYDEVYNLLLARLDLKTNLQEKSSEPIVIHKEVQPKQEVLSQKNVATAKAEVIEFYKKQFAPLYHTLFNNYLPKIINSDIKLLELLLYNYANEIIKSWHLDYQVKRYEFMQAKIPTEKIKVKPQIIANNLAPTKKIVEPNTNVQSDNSKSTKSILENIIRVCLVTAVILAYISSYLFIFDLIKVSPVFAAISANLITFSYIAIGEFLFRKAKYFNARIFTSIGLGLLNILNITFVLTNTINVVTFLTIMFIIHLVITVLNQRYKNNYYEYINFISPIIALLISEYYVEFIFAIATFSYITYSLVIFKKYQLQTKFADIFFFMPLYFLSAFLDFGIIKILLLSYIYYYTSKSNSKYHIYSLGFYFLGFATVQLTYPILVLTYLIPLIYKDKFKNYLLISMFIVLAVNIQNISYSYLLIFVLNLGVFILNSKFNWSKYLFVVVSLFVSFLLPVLLVVINYLLLLVLIKRLFKINSFNMIAIVLLYFATLLCLWGHLGLVFLITVITIIGYFVTKRFNFSTTIAVLTLGYICNFTNSEISLGYLVLAMGLTVYAHLKKPQFIAATFGTMFVGLVYYQLLIFNFETGFICFAGLFALSLIYMIKPFDYQYQVAISFISYLSLYLIIVILVLPAIYTYLIIVTSMISYIRVSKITTDYLIYGLVTTILVTTFSFNCTMFGLMFVILHNYKTGNKAQLFVNLNIVLCLAILFTMPYLQVMAALIMVVFNYYYQSDWIKQVISLLLMLLALIINPNVVMLILSYLIVSFLPKKYIRFITPTITFIALFLGLKFVIISFIALSLYSVKDRNFTDIPLWLLLFVGYSLVTGYTVVLAILGLCYIVCNLRLKINLATLITNWIVAILLVCCTTHLFFDLLVICNLAIIMYKSDTTKIYQHFTVYILVVCGLLSTDQLILSVSLITASAIQLKMAPKHSYNLIGFLVIINIFIDIDHQILLFLNLCLLGGISLVKTPKYLKEALILPSMFLIFNYQGLLIFGYLVLFSKILKYDRRIVAYILVILSVLTFSISIVLSAFMLLLVIICKRRLEFELMTLTSLVIAFFTVFDKSIAILFLSSVGLLLLYVLRYVSYRFNRYFLNILLALYFIHIWILVDYSLSMTFILIILALVMRSNLVITYVMLVLALFVSGNTSNFTLLVITSLAIYNGLKLRHISTPHEMLSMSYNYLIVMILVIKIFAMVQFVLSLALICVSSYYLYYAFSKKVRSQVITSAIILYGCLFKICFFDVSIQEYVHPAIVFLVISVLLLIMSNILKKLLK